MKIFVVDDDPSARLIAVDGLQGASHDIREFSAGADLLAAMDDAPDIVLLDIEMPEMDGIAACRALRQADNGQVQVIFVSAHDDLDTRLAAYDAGGNDFIVKPYYAEELVQKVRVVEQALARHQDVSQQAQFARSTAFTAMSSMGEMGVVLQFLRDSFSCATPEQLAGKTIEALRQYDLHGLLQIRLASVWRCFSSRGECTPLEISILEHAAGMGRIFQFFNRLAVNYPHVTLMVPDLPVDDPDRVGRLRDHLATLIEGVEARVQAMEIEQQRLTQSAGIVQATAELAQALADIEKSQAETRLRIMEIDAAYMEDLTGAFIHLGLTDGQENALAEMAQKTHTKFNALMDKDYFLGGQLRAIAERLRKLTAV